MPDKSDSEREAGHSGVPSEAKGPDRLLMKARDPGHPRPPDPGFGEVPPLAGVAKEEPDRLPSAASQVCCFPALLHRRNKQNSDTPRPPQSRPPGRPRWGRRRPSPAAGPGPAAALCLRDDCGELWPHAWLPAAQPPHSLRGVLRRAGCSKSKPGFLRPEESRGSRPLRQRRPRSTPRLLPGPGRAPG